MQLISTDRLYDLLWTGSMLNIWLSLSLPPHETRKGNQVESCSVAGLYMVMVHTNIRVFLASLRACVFLYQ